MTIVIAFMSMGLPWVMGQQHAVPPQLPLISVDKRCYWLWCFVMAATSIPDGSTEDFLFLHRLIIPVPWVLHRWVFSFRIEPSVGIFMLMFFFFFYFIFSGSHVVTVYTNEELTIWVSQLQPFGVCPWQAYVHPCVALWLMPGVHQVAEFPTALSRGCLMLLKLLLFLAIHAILWSVQYEQLRRE